jgi:hypothetical protein
MKIRSGRTPNLPRNTAKPGFKRFGLRNNNKSSRSPKSKNNISEIEQKETINFPNCQNSLMIFDISFNEASKNQEEYDNNSLYKKYLTSKTRYNKLVSEIEYVDNKIKENTKLIENLSNDLSKLKEEKKEKDATLLDLLSNKESLEEMYKINIASLKSNFKYDPTKLMVQAKDIQNDPVIASSTKNILDNNKVEITTKDIELSDREQFLNQVTSFTDEIAYKKDMDIKNRLNQKLNVGYQRFFSEINSPVPIESSKIVENFISKISIFIDNQNRGLYPECLIKSFLMQLLKINKINVDIAEILKFLNKKYKDNKNEIKEKIDNLMKKDINLKNKKLSFEINRDELKKFIDENRDKVKSGKNKIIENGNKQSMSFIFDKHLQDDLDFLNEAKGKKEEHQAIIKKF